MLRLPWKLTVLGGMLLMLAGCPERRDHSSKNEDLGLPPVPGQKPGVCTVKRSRTEPDLMGWDKHARVRLSQLRAQGVIAVRYTATCNSIELELLEHCIANGRYEYAEYPGSSAEKIIAENAGELSAKLPLGSLALGGSLKQGSALRIDYVLAGTQFIRADAEYTAKDLSGPECKRATHVVSSIHVGGFAFTRGASRDIQASATFFGMGAGGGQHQAIEEHFEEGDPQACLKARADGKYVSGCSVPLRLSLLPIAGRADGECPIGTRRQGDACVDAKEAEAPTKPPAPPPEKAGASVPLDTSGAHKSDALPPPTDTQGMIERMNQALKADQEGRLEDCVRYDRSALKFDENARTRLHLASCETRLGRLVDALKDAQAALQAGMTARDTALMKVARQRVMELLDRIPHVTFEPAPGAEITSVTFDERPVPLDSLMKKFSVDPGKHQVIMEGRLEQRRFRRVLQLEIEERDFTKIPVGPDGQPVTGRPDSP